MVILCPGKVTFDKEKKGLMKLGSVVNGFEQMKNVIGEMNCNFGFVLSPLWSHSCEIDLLCPDNIIFDKEMIEVMKFGSLMGYLLGIY